MKTKIRIKNVTSYKYLGVYLDRGLSFIEHINRLKMKVAKRLGALTRSRPFLTIVMMLLKSIQLWYCRSLATVTLFGTLSATHSNTN